MAVWVTVETRVAAKAVVIASTVVYETTVSGLVLVVVVTVTTMLMHWTVVVAVERMISTVGVDVSTTGDPKREVQAAYWVRRLLST